jgi:predicted RNase H-like HicB family nuclease
MRLTASVTKEDSLYVAQCLEIDIASQGDTIEEALRNLKEAVSLRLETEPTLEINTSPMLIAPLEIEAR